MNKISSFEDAYKVLGLTEDKNSYPPAIRKSIRASIQLTIITKALNEGWTPDYSDTTESKWHVWGFIDSNTKKFSLTVSTSPGGGSLIVNGLLVYKDPKIANFSAKKFKQLWHDLLNPQIETCEQEFYELIQNSHLMKE